jgi:prepilin-type processing-associated H-X9-DG protein
MILGPRTQVQRPSLTPVLADSVTLFVSPLETDAPPTNLVYGASGMFSPGNSGGGEMSWVAIPRHGARPNPVPTYWPANQPLPGGGVNVAFFDGHGELVKLDQLWQLYWHPNYQPPAIRPGLQ